MSLNMERFTRPGEEAIYLAHQIVSEGKQQKMEAEHLTLSLLRCTEGLITRIWPVLKVDVSLLEAELQRYLSKLGPSENTVTDVYLSFSCEQCIQKAEHEADRMRDEFIGPEHLILGILANTGTEASTILRAQGIDQKGFIKAIDDLRGDQRITSRGETDELEFVTQYCQDFVTLAKENKFDPVVGRDEEVRRVIQVLSRRSKNNPVLIGEPGVGKTAIIEGLAQRIHQGDVPESMKGASLMSLDLAAMVAGAKYRGEFEDRLKKLLKEIETAGQHIILFIDELHTLVGAGASEGALDASNMLKPALARGVIRCVGATTITEFKQYIEKDPALGRRFQQVLVKEPTVEACITILRGLKGKYEVHHGVRIKDSAIIASARLADRYIPDRFLPDKAIDLLDEAASKVRIEIDSVPTVIDQAERKALGLEIERAALVKEEDEDSKQRVTELDHEIHRYRLQAGELRTKWQEERHAIGKIRALKAELERTTQEEVEAQRSGNLERAATLKYGVIDGLQRELDQANQLLSNSKVGRLLKEEIDEEDIAQIIAKWTGIPISRMMMDEQVKLLHLEQVLAQKVIGQEPAIHAVSNAIRRARTGIQDPDRPLGSFIFMGPTGVGKTELAKCLAAFLFDDHRAMIRLDMSEYMEKHSVSRLVGAPPGYTGFDEGGLLTEAVRRKPYSVVLFDEVEKGHPEVFNVLLQILDEGTLTDSRGMHVDFKNTIIILTTNLGSEQVLQNYLDDKPVSAQMARRILLTQFRPEMLNRLDEVIVFEPLAIEEAEQLVELQVQKLSERLEKNSNMILKVHPDACRRMAEMGFDREFGARPLKRLIQRELEDKLAYKILNGTITPGDQIEVRFNGERLTFHRLRPSGAAHSPKNSTD